MQTSSCSIMYHPMYNNVSAKVDIFFLSTNLFSLFFEHSLQKNNNNLNINNIHPDFFFCQKKFFFFLFICIWKSRNLPVILLPNYNSKNRLRNVYSTCFLHRRIFLLLRKTGRKRFCSDFHFPNLWGGGVNLSLSATYTHFFTIRPFPTDAAIACYCAGGGVSSSHNPGRCPEPSAAAVPSRLRQTAPCAHWEQIDFFSTKTCLPANPNKLG
jgi:hypothetical protein